MQCSGHGLKAVFANLQVVAIGKEAVDAARSDALLASLPARCAERRSGAEHVGDDVDGATASRGHGMIARVGRVGGILGRVVVLDVVHDANVGGCLTEEGQ